MPSCRVFRMKLALAVFTLLVLAAVNPHVWAQSPPPAAVEQSPSSDKQDARGTQAPSLTQPNQPCAPSKDTCELNEPATPAPAQSAATKDQPPNTKAKVSSHKQHKKRRRKVSHKKPPTTQHPANPIKTVVRAGGTSDPATTLTPGVAAPQPNYSRESIVDLLSSADTNLKRAAERTLSANQQADADQIRIFIEQANTAMNVGDLDRAHNLAMKAHLLSDDLVK